MFPKIKADTLPHYSFDEARELDQISQSHFGITTEMLMEVAGFQSAMAIQHLYQHDTPVIVVCGVGHNGGDGFVTARHLSQMGFDIYILLSRPASFFKGVPGTQLQICQALNLPITDSSDTILNSLSRGALIIDAIFGIGLKSPPKPSESNLIHKLNALSHDIVSLDIPSGLYGETLPSCRIAPTYTLAYGCLKSVFNYFSHDIGKLLLLYIGLSSKPALREPILEVIY